MECVSFICTTRTFCRFAYVVVVVVFCRQFGLTAAYRREPLLQSTEASRVSFAISARRPNMVASFAWSSLTVKSFLRLWGLISHQSGGRLYLLQTLYRHTDTLGLTPFPSLSHHYYVLLHDNTHSITFCIHSTHQAPNSHT